MKSLWMLVGLLGSPWKHVLGPGLPVLMWDHGRLLLLLHVKLFSRVEVFPEDSWNWLRRLVQPLNGIVAPLLSSRTLRQALHMVLVRRLEAVGLWHINIAEWTSELQRKMAEW